MSDTNETPEAKRRNDQKGRERDMTSAHHDLIEQLEQAFAQSDMRQRAETLRRLTDLFVTGAETFTGEQIELFDEVMIRLIEEIDVTARAVFGRRMAEVAQAPVRVMRGLALDDAIEVAGPVLRVSERLEDETLIETARTKSQQHLLAISRRKVINEPVTDVLVSRGNRAVAVSTAGNAGARLSDYGYTTLVERAHDDRDLAIAVWVRPEIPRQHLLALFGQASEAVRRRLEAADRAKGGLLQEVIAQASNRLQTELREGSAVYSVARARVIKLHRAGELDEAHLAAFATAGRFDEATIALSLMAGLSIGMIERAIANQRTEQILVLAKAIGLGWDTAKAILLLQAGTKGTTAPELDRCCETFARLRLDTAQKALQFYRLRERATKPN
jgi:uncharacterized protein (DUF2336 family)